MKQKRKKQRYGEFIRKINYPAERKRIIKLKKDLLRLGKFPSGNPRKIILYNIDFFKYVSEFQDEGYLKYQPENLKAIQNLFNFTIKQSGRQTSPDKWNVTKKGEPVTKYTVTYGGIYQLGIKPAIYWLNLPKSQKISIDYYSRIAVNPLSSPVVTTKEIWATQAIVEARIEKFTQSNSQLLLKCIDKLLESNV